MLQEECDKLINATIDGDMEVVSTLINDGVDMNAILDKVRNLFMSAYEVTTTRYKRYIQYITYVATYVCRYSLKI